MDTGEKRKILVLLAAIAAGMILIAGTLSELNLEKGTPPALYGGTVRGSGAAYGTDSDAVPYVDMNFKVFFLILFASVLLYSLYKVTRLLGWKELRKILTVFISISVLVIVVFGVFFFMTDKESRTDADESPPSHVIELRSTPLGPVPAVLLMIVGSVAAVLVLYAGLRITSAKNRTRHPADGLELEAERARRALAEGADLKDVITQCYRGMTAAVETGRGLSRAESMTTGEFEARLEAEGIGRENVKELTRLFESVRYGDRRPDPTEERAAVRCLEAIVSSLRTEGEEKSES